MQRPWAELATQIAVVALCLTAGCQRMVQCNPYRSEPIIVSSPIVTGSDNRESPAPGSTPALLPQASPALSPPPAPIAVSKDSLPIVQSIGPKPAPVGSAQMRKPADFPPTIAPTAPPVVPPTSMRTAATAGPHCASNYSWLIGELQYVHVRNAWRIRYLPPGEDDRYGGTVTLVETGPMTAFRSGEIVRVEGALVDPKSSEPSPAYRVRLIQPANSEASTR